MTIQQAIEKITALGGAVTINAVKADGTVCGFAKMFNGENNFPVFAFGGKDTDNEGELLEPLPTIEMLAGKIDAILAAKGERIEIHTGGEVAVRLRFWDDEYIPFKDI